MEKMGVDLFVCPLYKVWMIQLMITVIVGLGPGGLGWFFGVHS